jgi:hypothetical protein
MKVTVTATVEDVLTALDLAVIPAECDPDLKMTDEIEIEGEADEDDIADLAIESGKAADKDAGELSSILDRETVESLTAAIRRGDTQEAELMLDRLLAEDDTVTHWVQVARYSPKARRPAVPFAKAA